MCGASESVCVRQRARECVCIFVCVSECVCVCKRVCVSVTSVHYQAVRTVACEHEGGHDRIDGIVVKHLI